jgi:AraC-like DNA-binding protein
MKTIFSTAAVHPRNRFDYWHSVACNNVVNHDSKPECRQNFEAELRSGALADITFFLFENSPMAIEHTAGHVGRANAAEVFVYRQVAGMLAIEQAGREAILKPGDITLLDPGLPYAGKFSSGSKSLALKVPRRLLEARLGKTREIMLHPITPSAGEGRLTSALVAMLPANADKLDPATQEIVKDQVLDLVAVAVTKATDRGKPRVSSARSLVLVNVRAAIEARLTDPALDAQTIAAAAGVSVRYANAVLAQEGTSMMRLIQARRLARCRRALADPSQAHRTVSEIAFGWGFADMTHFGRKFRAAYGSLPSEYRRRQGTSVRNGLDGAD